MTSSSSTLLDDPDQKRNVKARLILVQRATSTTEPAALQSTTEHTEKYHFGGLVPR